MFIKGYSNLKVKIPDCHSGGSFWAANFELDPKNISDLFPYINAVSKEAKYFKNPHYIEFIYNKIRCALYEDKAVIAPFEDKESVIDFLNDFILFLNDLYERKDSIEPDHGKYRHVSVLDIMRLLPGTNCGICGFRTCMAYAASLSKGEISLEKCDESGNLTIESMERLRSVFDS